MTSIPRTFVMAKKYKVVFIPQSTMPYREPRLVVNKLVLE